ncbi:MAG: hypothetical protein ACHQ4G_01405 [Opitutales bacterium]
MSHLEGFALIPGIGAVLLLAGYGLASRLPGTTVAERLAAALLGGLASLLLLVSIVNFFRPLAGGWAWACLLPCAFTLVDGRSRRTLSGDLAALTRSRRRRLLVYACATTAFVCFLLWPLLRNPALVFYDGSSNHDSFFWIVSAGYLQGHTYMTVPGPDPANPLASVAAVITGLFPPWGRMGSEGLLALASSLLGRPPLEIYNCATAALFLPWVAGVYLVIKTFVADGLDPFSAVLMVVFQPIFLFTQCNANLPNLVGIITGTLMIVAVARALGPNPGVGRALPWLALAALAEHGTLCSYPEVLPFVLLPGMLLVLRAFWRRQVAARLLGLGALALGFALNWVSTARGINGFFHSFFSARADSQWVDIFRALEPTEIFPVLTTLMVNAGSWIGPWLGGALSALLVAVFVYVLRRARDPVGLCFALAGSAVLLGYTFATGFHYGMQKSVQFGGVAMAAVFPAGCLVVLRQARLPGETGQLGRRLALGSIVALVLFYGFALVLGAIKLPYRHAAWKGLLRENLALRHHPIPELQGGRVLVVGESFFMSFFHGMWADYCLPQAHLVYSSLDLYPGGYLAPHIQIYHPGESPAPAAVYVSRPWADTVDANSRRLLAGASFAVLRETNYVLRRDGLYPREGVPHFTAASFELVLLPHRSSWLHLALTPIDSDRSRGQLLVTRRTPGGDSWTGRAGDTSPWQLAVPLIAGVENRITANIVAPDLPDDDYPLELTRLEISDHP